jgi:hypothetical protein
VVLGTAGVLGELACWRAGVLESWRAEGAGVGGAGVLVGQLGVLVG